MAKKLKNKEVSIGWDVGGWSGKNHGFSLLISENDQIELVKAVKLNVFEVKENIIAILDQYRSSHTITIGIDAPLQFPKIFKDIIANEPTSLFQNIQSRPKENPIAWRETDLYIKKHFGKTPLSPSFSFLTSNATVAITMIGELKSNYKELAILPFDEKSNINAIEVYPGLLKSIRLRESDKLYKYQSILKKFKLDQSLGYSYYFEDGKEKSDDFDAVICALYGFGFNASQVEIPPLDLKIPRELVHSAKTEGWIYYPKH